MKRLLLLTLVFIAIDATPQDITMDLWDRPIVPHRIPTDETEKHETDGILRISRVQFPSMDVYLPKSGTATGRAVLILPGGGYQILAYHWEGTQFAKWLQSKGIAGIVLKYRLPTSRSLVNGQWAPLSDAQRALRLCRHMANSWGIDPDKIGVMGFSAGGHLAAMLSTKYAEEVYPPTDAIDGLSARPDFSVLIYPVITFTGPDMHLGSRQALLGEDPTDDMLRFFSPELNADARTPPAFLLHASDDAGVPPGNSLLYYQALLKQGTPASLHIFPKGGHGFAMGEKIPLLRDWPEMLLAWFRIL